MRNAVENSGSWIRQNSVNYQRTRIPQNQATFQKNGDSKSFTALHKTTIEQFAGHRYDIHAPTISKSIVTAGCCC